jgi:hypothetical protein
MAYCVFGDVRARCDTDITDAEITSLIQESDAWLDLKLTMSGLTVPMRRLLSATLTAIRCMLKDPDSQAIGEYREDRAAALKKLNSMMDEMIADATGGIGFRYGYESVPRTYVAVG